MERPNLIYMPEETTPTIATEGNRKAVAYLELNEGDDNHDYYGRLFAASPPLLEKLEEFVEIVEEWIAADLVHPYDEDAGESADTFLDPYRRAIADAKGPELPKPFSILLLYPNSDNEGGAETYLAHVSAANKKQAIMLARDEACKLNEWKLERARDFPVLLVAEGYIADLGVAA
jgi:hypothetical protein